VCGLVEKFYLEEDQQEPISFNFENEKLSLDSLKQMISDEVSFHTI